MQSLCITAHTLYIQYTYMCMYVCMHNIYVHVCIVCMYSTYVHVCTLYSIYYVHVCTYNTVPGAEGGEVVSCNIPFCLHLIPKDVGRIKGVFLCAVLCLVTHGEVNVLACSGRIVPVDLVYESVKQLCKSCVTVLISRYTAHNGVSSFLVSRLVHTCMHADYRHTR